MTVFYVHYARPGIRVLAYKGRSRSKADTIAEQRRACGNHVLITAGTKRVKIIRELPILVGR